MSVDTKKKIEDLFLSDEFKELDAKLTEKGPNIFRILGLYSNEIRFSKFLAWLMNPNGSHRLGDKFLKAFLERVLIEVPDKKKKDLDYTAIDIHTMRFNDADIRTEEQLLDKKNRGDITIRCRSDNLFCLIENKIWAKEGSDQTKRYAIKAEEIVKNERYTKPPLLIFLTPYGHAARNRKFLPISFFSLVELFDKLVNSNKDMEPVTASLIEQFKDNLKGVIGMSDYKDLCYKLWSQHKEAIEKLNEYIPNPATFLADALTRATVISREKTESWQGIKVKKISSNQGHWALITPDRWLKKGHRTYGDAYYQITWLPDSTGSKIKEVRIGIGCRAEFKDKESELSEVFDASDKMQASGEKHNSLWISKKIAIEKDYNSENTHDNWDAQVNEAATKISEFLNKYPPQVIEEKMPELLNEYSNKL